MQRAIVVLLAMLTLDVLVERSADAQRPGARPRQDNRQQTNQERRKKPEPPPLPKDKRLLALHQKFVHDAEKLAAEYERDRDWDKAMDVYGEIVKLVPQYGPAQKKLEELRQREARAGRVRVTIQADEGWQDSGIVVLKDKPVAIRATGTWTCIVKAELGADGMTIPKEMREYTLGSLVGVIDSGDSDQDKPFVVGKEKSLVAKKTGRLLLRMYDEDPKDNEGSLKVEIVGTFKQR